MRTLALSLFLMIPRGAAALDAPPPVPCKPELVSDDLEQPVAFAVAPHQRDRLYVVERSGTVQILQDGKPTGDELLDLSDAVRNAPERGLMSLAFHPNYRENGLAYAYYVDVNGDATVAQFSTGGEDVPDRDSITVTIKIAQSSPNRNGGWLSFGPDQALYVSSGSGGGSLAAPESPANLFGKILRIEPKSQGGYSTPGSNPLLKAAGAAGEVWAAGFSSPDFFAVGPKAERALVLDHSPAGSSVLLIRPGGSAGKAEAAYRARSGEKLVGGALFRGEKGPQPNGAFVVADSTTGSVFALKEQDGTWERSAIATVPEGAISALGADLRGNLFIATAQGSLYRCPRPSLPF